MGAGIIPTMPSRRQIEEIVEALRAEHDGGPAFAEFLLQRAAEEGAFQRGMALRLGSRGWFRRQLDKLEPPGGRTP